MSGNTNLENPLSLTERLTGYTQDEIKSENLDESVIASWEQLYNENKELNSLFNKNASATELALFFAKSRQSLIKQLWLTYRVHNLLQKALQHTKTQLEKTVESLPCS